MQHKLDIRGASPEVLEARISDDLKSVVLTFNTRITGSSASCRLGVLIGGQSLKGIFSIPLFHTLTNGLFIFLIIARVLLQTS